MSSTTLARTAGDRRVAAHPASTTHRLPDLRRWISPVAILLVWQLASTTGLLAEDELASPLRVVTAAVDVTASGELPEGLLVSLGRVATGLVLGLAVGVGLGLLSGLSRWGDHLVDPPVQMLRTLPHLGLVPLFILWFGIGELPKVLLVALGVLFPMYLNVHAGVRGVDPKLLEAASVSGFTRAERLRHVVLPGAMPSTLTGLRLALGIAWLSIIVAETTSADAGLGYMIMNAREFLRTDVIVVGLAVYALLGLGTDLLVRKLERTVLAWRPAGPAGGDR
ncbi:Alkanesulfonates transport system permease protein [Pseudonocardia sp. Ae168_Ps1]|uniref:ABC transporter permease n=1 Tax=unclassified Pseudonocardia TaxID=2619320 RepID=UPI00094B03D1|nr:MULTISPECIES: ABC transporter permease [unclassified Pseudonocardia]OLL73069.1 Alkanesulfonates transport system permease protein [Pseudonocardia sp. Ae150A_Ps1]OLL79044.1 Alkanesulfonates transport system permease protein [Pseudonocardia sp. Ae168_Ps1]OLL86818.1 Alkanesulfonates transport system permease protein [Pseudonocardia sp. Ae263_Ps1]OLL93138.1 Alkanesulfonates transport system permease protein [Pseudonocardia sp. Ae356_Ps1]